MSLLLLLHHYLFQRLASAPLLYLRQLLAAPLDILLLPWVAASHHDFAFGLLATLSDEPLTFAEVLPLDLLSALLFRVLNTLKLGGGDGGPVDGGVHHGNEEKEGC